jgi:hypothetical protein
MAGEFPSLLRLIHFQESSNPTPPHREIALDADASLQAPFAGPASRPYRANGAVPLAPLGSEHLHCSQAGHDLPYLVLIQNTVAGFYPRPVVTVFRRIEGVGGGPL